MNIKYFNTYIANALTVLKYNREKEISGLLKAQYHDKTQIQFILNATDGPTAGAFWALGSIIIDLFQNTFSHEPRKHSTEKQGC